MRKLMLSAICLLFALAGKAEGVSSPSGQVKLDFELSKNGAPTYQVEYKGCLLYTSPSPRDRG